jgi:photosystem II stability/assembly factor-like uncharacterized protein
MPRAKQIRKALFLCFLIGIGLGPTDTVSADADVWASIGPYGGNIDVLAAATSTTLYAGTHDGGLFGTMDSGETWFAANNGLANSNIRAFVSSPMIITRLYAGTFGGGVFKSTDGGGSWSAANTGLTNPNIQSMAINPSDSAILYAGTEGGVFKTMDGGTTWTACNSGLTNTDVQSLAIDPSDPATLYAGTNGGGVFKSIMGGANWYAVNGGLGYMDVRSLAIDPSATATLYAGTNGGVYKSENGGATWTGMTGGLTNTDVQTLAIDPSSTATLYAGTNGGGVFKSANGGGNWSAVNNGLTDLLIQSLAIDPSLPDTLFAGTNRAGVFKSADGGGNWTPANTGLANTYANDLEIDPSTPDILYAGTGSGVFKSTDKGASWNPANTGLTNTDIQTLAIDPSLTDTLLAGTNGGGVFISMNGGGNWAGMNTGLTDPCVQVLAIKPSSPITFYAGTNGGGVFRNISGGIWSAINTGLTNTDVLSLAIDPSNPATLYAGTNGDGVFKSTNGGTNWNAVNTGLTNGIVNVLAINPATPDILYAGTFTGGVFVSLDGGAHWSEANTGLTNGIVIALAINPALPDILYAGTSGSGVFISTNGGGNWSAINDELANPNILSLAIDPSTPTFLYAGTNGGGIFSLEQSPPGAFEKIEPDDGFEAAISPTLSWNESDGSTGYAYCYDTSDNDACDAAWISTGDSTEAELSGLAYNTVYYWQVRAAGAGGTTEADGGVWRSFSTPPPPPGAFGKSAPADGSTVSPNPTISWSTSSGATGYEYCYDTTNNNTCDGSWIANAFATSAVLSGLANTTTYYWQVRAVNTHGSTAADGGLWWSFTTQPPPPGAFGKIYPADGANATGNVMLLWNSSNGLYEYCFDTINNNACDASWINTGAAPTATLSGLAESTTYYWQVRATNPYGSTEADSGDWWSFSTFPSPGSFGKTAPADGVNATTSPTLTWEASAHATGYEYCYGTINNQTCDVPWISTGSATSVDLSLLPEDTTFYWQVRAVNPAGYTQADGGAWWGFTTAATPSTFAKTEPSDGSYVSTGPALSWEASYGATGYEYCFDMNNNDACDSSWVSAGSSTSAGLSGLSTDRTYYWQIRAVNPYGQTEADDGAWWSFLTPVTDVPGAFGKTAPADGAYAGSDSPFSWGISSGASSYEICINTANVPTCAGSWILLGNFNSIVFELDENLSFSWQVRAVNALGTTEADGGSWRSVKYRIPTFADVPVSNPLWAFVEAFYSAGITTGCGVSPLIYCPESPVTRAAMAVFLLRAKYGAGYAPPTATHTFADLPVAGKEWQEAWVDQFYLEGITTGCGVSPLIYCPENPVTRAAMAVFILRALEGASYTPPAASHFFADLPVAGKEWMEPWVDELYRRSITTGCGTGPLIYCPETAVKRQAMAAFIVRAFNLPLP